MKQNYTHLIEYRDVNEPVIGTLVDATGYTDVRRDNTNSIIFLCVHESIPMCQLEWDVRANDEDEEKSGLRIDARQLSIYLSVYCANNCRSKIFIRTVKGDDCWI